MVSSLRNHKLSLLSKTRLKIFIKNIYQHNKWKTGCLVLSCFSSALLFYRAQSAFRKGHLPAATMICPERVPCPNWTLDQTHGDAHLAKTDDGWWCPECPKFCPFAQVMGDACPDDDAQHCPAQSTCPIRLLHWWSGAPTSLGNPFRTGQQTTNSNDCGNHNCKREGVFLLIVFEKLTKDKVWYK